MSNTPSDEELTACYREANGEMHGKAQPLTTQRIFRAMRAAIVKWGTPQPVVREPLTDAQIAKMMRDTCDSADGYNGPYQFHDDKAVEAAITAARARLGEQT